MIDTSATDAGLFRSLFEMALDAMIETTLESKDTGSIRNVDSR